LVGVATSPEVNNSLTLKTVQTKFEIPAPQYLGWETGTQSRHVKKQGSNEKSFKNNFLERGRVRDGRCTPTCKDTFKKDSSEVKCYVSTFIRLLPLFRDVTQRWLIFSEVSPQHFIPIFKGQTVDDMVGSLSRYVGDRLPTSAV
jgi:hypothetical protein